MSEHPPRPLLNFPSKIVIGGFVLVLGTLLLTEHRVHVLGWLSLMLVLLCPLLHLTMHGSHGNHGSRRGDDDESPHGQRNHEQQP